MYRYMIYLTHIFGSPFGPTCSYQIHNVKLQPHSDSPSDAKFWQERWQISQSLHHVTRSLGRGQDEISVLRYLRSERKVSKLQNVVLPANSLVTVIYLNELALKRKPINFGLFVLAMIHGVFFSNHFPFSLTKCAQKRFSRFSQGQNFFSLSLFFFQSSPCLIQIKRTRRNGQNTPKPFWMRSRRGETTKIKWVCLNLGILLLMGLVFFFFFGWFGLGWMPVRWVG